MSCNKVHVPNQQGPTDEGLQKIEVIRARDHEVYLERKAKKAKQRAKARAMPPKEDSDETAVVAGTGKPFGVRALLPAKTKPADSILTQILNNSIVSRPQVPLSQNFTDTIR